MPNAHTIIKTNSNANSIHKVQLKTVTFSELWKAYPWGKPCKGPYQDQCAARLGVSLNTAGVDVRSFQGVKCSVDHPGHMLRAAEIASWLQRIPFAGCPKPKKITGKDWEETVKNKTGIIFFNGYWHRDTDPPNVTSGNHIDLWDGGKLTKSSIPDAFATISRFDFGMQSFSIGPYSFSDLRNSSSILFWEIK